MSVALIFQPTRPLRGATHIAFNAAHVVGISTHAPLAGRDQDVHGSGIDRVISTHAPLAGRDVPRAISTSPRTYFNPRAPCGARPWKRLKRRPLQAFQPTRPLRGATFCFSSHTRRISISTHAPLAGRDPVPAANIFDKIKFQPTRPLRGATAARAPQGESIEISTHAPLAGRDQVFAFSMPFGWEISTHAPLAGRDWVKCITSDCVEISTHAPLAGRDPTDFPPKGYPPYFNPRAPCGARPSSVSGFSSANTHFNPRAPCGARRELRRLRE